ncbi:MAG: HAD-IIA family hydrolase [Hyphomicrobiaceae bacterium]
MMDEATRASGQWAFERYETVRHRLPKARFPGEPEYANGLEDLRDEFDAFVFDSFGVLNVGETPIPGARECIEALRARGKHIAVLTNAATVPLAKLQQKYAELGFAFDRNEIISSREVLGQALNCADNDLPWGVAAPISSNIDEFAIEYQSLTESDSAFDQSGGFVLLSSTDWNDRMQARLSKALTSRPRPLMIGNPDLVAPRELGFSLEPGAYAHDLADRLDIEPVFFGKPFSNAFDAVKARIKSDIAPHRIAMIGDTLHTDILGGAAAGWRTILVTDDGLMKDLDFIACIERSSIVPNYIVPRI